MLAEQRAYYEKNKKRILERVQEYRRKNLPAVKEAERRRKYGLQEGAFKKLLQNQKGLCACCKVVLTHPNIDHNHVTGAVRGILCGNCNKGIGQARENISVLKSWIEYLEFHSQKGGI